MRPPSNTTPVTYSALMGGRKYPWQHVDSTDEQQKSVTTKSIETFLASVNKDPAGSALAKLGAEILSMHYEHDYFMMTVNNKVRKRYVDEKERMEEHATRFIDDIVKGMKRTEESIRANTEPLPEDLADDTGNRLMEELQAYQAWMKKRASRVKECFCVLDREMHKKHEEICENDKKMLLEQFEAIYAAQFEAIKAAQDSALSSYIADLREAASVQGVDIDPILAAVPVPVAVSVSCSAPSTSTTAATPSPTETELSNDYERSGSMGSKRRRLPDHRGSEN